MNINQNVRLIINKIKSINNNEDVRSSISSIDK